MWTDIKPGSRVRVSSNDFYNGVTGTVSTDRKIGEEAFHYVILDRAVIFRNVSYAAGVFANSELIELEGRTCLN